MADELLPVVRKDGALESYTHSELLTRWAHSGIIRCIETVERVRDPDDVKGERLACEMGAVGAKLLATVQAAELRGARQDNLLSVLQSIAEFQAKK